MLLRIVVEAEGDPLQAKEDLAMALERYAPARVVEVAPVYRQTEMAAEPRSRCSVVSPEATDSTSFGASRHLPLEGKAPQGGRCADELKSGRMLSREGPGGCAAVAAPTDGVVGPFARADAALKAAMEANEEIRR